MVHSEKSSEMTKNQYILGFFVVPKRKILHKIRAAVVADVIVILTRDPEQMEQTKHYLSVVSFFES